MTSSSASNSTRVLVVDDEKVIADTLKLILDRNGFQASAVYDGVAAIDTARDWAPHILLCDVIMPGPNGVEVAMQVRGMDPSCKIFLFSGQAGVEDLLRDARLRGYDFDLLLKPIHPIELLKLIR